MAPCVITLCSDWPLRLLRFRFHNAQSKCAPVAFKQTICFVHFRYGSGIKKFQNCSLNQADSTYSSSPKQENE